MTAIVLRIDPAMTRSQIESSAESALRYVHPMRTRDLALAIAGCTLAITPLRAQGLEAFASRFTVSAMAGALRIDDSGLGFDFESSGGPRFEGHSELAPLVGVAVGFDVATFLTIEGYYNRASAPIGMDASLGGVRLPDPVLEEKRVEVQLYAIRGRVSFPAETPFRASIVLGRGTVNADVDVTILEDGERVGPSGSTAREPLWDVGGGVEWAPGAHWGVRAEIIDHLQLCSGETHSEINICGRDGSIDRLHHTAFTVAATARL
jgi:hypothetical protein